MLEVVHAVQHGVVGEAFDIGPHGGQHLCLEQEEIRRIVEGDLLDLLVDFRTAIFVGHHFRLTKEAVRFIILIEGPVPWEAPVGRIHPVGQEELGITVVRAPGA